MEEYYNYLKEIGTVLVQYGVQWGVVVNMVMDLPIPNYMADFFTT
jgi:hypothetical protein